MAQRKSKRKVSEVARKREMKGRASKGRYQNEGLANEGKQRGREGKERGREVKGRKREGKGRGHRAQGRIRPMTGNALFKPMSSSRLIWPLQQGLVQVAMRERCSVGLSCPSCKCDASRASPLARGFSKARAGWRASAVLPS